MSDAPRTDSRPNIVVILVDDMGYADIGPYGSEIETPNLNRMAERGVRFTQAYNCARCCPTRASLLTGLYPHKAGVGHMVSDAGLPGYRGHLTENCVTIAEALGAASYRTYMSGKWHVGGAHAPHIRETWDVSGSPGWPTPTQRGFDRFWGSLSGGGSYFRPPTLMDQDRFVEPEGDFYYTDDISHKAAEFIDDATEHDAPFFMYVAYTAPHWPLHARPEDIAKFEGRYRDGWDALRTSRHEELKGLGILNPDWDISPRDSDAPPWEDAEHLDWQALRMAVYAAQVHAMDRGVGTILDKLREQGMEENTLVMFLADNGGCAEFLAEDGPRSPKRYDIPTRDGGRVHVGNAPSLRPGAEDTFMSYDLPWANASNAPFRLFKHWVHEGGISTPLIVQWPESIDRASIVHESCHVCDIMPTCLEAAGAGYPSEFNGVPIKALDGESFLPAVRGQGWRREQPIYFEHEGNCAVRDGDWKLVRKYPGDWELYSMEKDRTETVDLAATEGGRVVAFEANYAAWAERSDVVTREELIEHAERVKNQTP